MTVSVMVGDRVRDWAKLRLTSRSPVKVVAGEDLCRGASATFFLKEVSRGLLTQDGFKIHSERAPRNEIKMKGNSLVASYPSYPSSATSWLSDMTLAEDVHSESGRLELDSEALIGSEHILKLTLTRNVKKMEHLTFWFSSDLAAKLGFPFLNFSHIKDGLYYCSKCSRAFEAPNPLKLHIATSCESLKPEDVWCRLWNNSASSSSLWSFPKFTHQNSTTQKISSKLPNHLMASNTDNKSKPLSPDSTSSSYPEIGLKYKSRNSINYQSNPLTVRKSAFNPVSDTLQNCAKNLSCHEISSSSLQTNNLHLFGHHNLQGIYTVHPLNTFPLTSLSRNPLMPSSSLNHLKWPPLPSLSPPSGPNSPQVKPFINSPHPLFDPLPSTSASDPYAEVETLVSSLGRGKGTHLCLYCGKVYSRKYGLKIHIRTHTGYKPLKCRVCLRPFGDPSNLNKHVRLHAQGDTPYRCDLCGKVLVRKRDLDRHLRSRHSRESIDDVLQSSTTDVTDPDDDDCDDIDIDVDVDIDVEGGANDQHSHFEETTVEVKV